jgi:hypothetical protein
MKKLFTCLMFVSLMGLPLLSGCMDLGPTSNNNPVRNSPTIGNTLNSFAFTANGQFTNYTDVQNLQINAQSLAVGITVTGNVSGSVKIDIQDGNGTTIYEKDATGNVVVGEVITLTTIPKTITINLSNFTGTIAIGLSGK